MITTTNRDPGAGGHLTPEQIASRYRAALDILTLMILAEENRHDYGTDPEGFRNHSGSDLNSLTLEKLDIPSKWLILT